MGEDGYVREGAALDEGEGGLGAEGAGGVGGATPDWLELNVAQSGEEGFGFLVLEEGKRLDNFELGPALRVGLDGVLEETLEGLGEFAGESQVLMSGNQPGGFGHEEVVAVGEEFAKRAFGLRGRKVAKGIEGGEILVEGGHKAKG